MKDEPTFEDTELLRMHREVSRRLHGGITLATGYERWATEALELEIKEHTKKYVVGLLLSPDLNMVVLLLKTTGPSFLRGMLNGVGGHVEQGEPPIEAIRREFKEEAGMDIVDWDEVCVLTLCKEPAEVHFYCALGDVNSARTTGAEQVSIYSIISVMSLPLVMLDVRYVLERAIDYYSKVGWSR